MKLIVGLGNPGRKYQGTRHNVGFDVISQLVDRYGEGGFRNRFESDLCTARVGNAAVLLQLPRTYMNLSGSAVLAARDFYRVELSDVLIVCDDFNLPLAQIRFRATGSAGGQKGLQDIIRRLGSNDIPRLRFGIGTPPPKWDKADFVLSRFAADELSLVASSIQRAADAVSDWVEQGIEFCMNRYNTKQSNQQQSGD